MQVDTGINDIIITGAFNYNMLNAQPSNKIKSICEKFSLTQTIDSPTHCTEHFSSLIDIILTNIETHMVYSGVGDPFSNQEIRHHCPVFVVVDFLFIVTPIVGVCNCPCFVVRYCMSILVWQSSWWRRESRCLSLICLPGVSWWLSGPSSHCHGVVCGLWLWYFLIILTYFFWHSKLHQTKS